MHANRASTAQGFTLLEVLAALVIISLGMLGVIEAVGQTASNSTRMRDRMIAHWVGMNRLTAVRLEPRPPKVDKTSDEVEMAGRRWRWTMEVTETPVQSLRRIDIRVAEAEAGEDATLATVTGFYGSAIAAPGSSTSVWQMTPASNVPPGEEQPKDGDNNDPEPPPPPNEPEPVDPPLPDQPEPTE
jgi:general secretion pathway protein I